ncbi:MAG: hypothetical protein ACP5G8_07450 [Athalassotoga sp.]
MQLYYFLSLLNENKYRKEHMKENFFDVCLNYFVSIRPYVDPELVSLVDDFIRRVRLTIQLLPKDVNKDLEKFIRQNHKHPTDKAVLEKIKELSKDPFHLDEFDFRVSLNATRKVKRLFNEGKYTKVNKPMTLVEMGQLRTKIIKEIDHEMTDEERATLSRELLGEVLEVDLEGTLDGETSILDVVELFVGTISRGIEG